MGRNIKSSRKKRDELNEFQSSFKVEPSSNMINPDGVDEEYFGEFGEGEQDDQKDSYDFELAEVLLSKIEIEAK